MGTYPDSKNDQETETRAATKINKDKDIGYQRVKNSDLRSWLKMEGGAWQMNADLVADQQFAMDTIRELRATAPKRPRKLSKTELYRQRINTSLKYRPGIYVDASIRGRYARIVALITLGSYMPRAARMRSFLCKSSNRAEYYAILLGNQVRGPNEHLPIYTDNSGCVQKQIVENLVWIQRDDNRIAHNWVKGPKKITIKYP